MRDLTASEMLWVSGAGDDCSSGDGGGDTSLGSIPDTKTVGQRMIDVYEGAVEVTSHIIERVATALK